MKTLIAILTLVVGVTALPLDTQAAPSRYRSHHGDNVEYRKVRRLVGYTRRGVPIYRWRTIAIYHDRDRHRDYGYGSGYRRSYRRY